MPRLDVVHIQQLHLQQCLVWTMEYIEQQSSLRRSRCGPGAGRARASAGLGNILTEEREDFSLINQNDLSIRFRIEHNIYLVLGRHSHSGETKQSRAGAGCEW